MSAASYLDLWAERGYALRLPTRWIDASTGREFGGGRVAAFMLTAAPDGKTLAGNYEMQQNQQSRYFVEVWDVPPRRSTRIFFIVATIWSALFAASFGGVILCSRRRRKR